jgi:SAM-dependent methyltransferase
VTTARELYTHWAGEPEYDPRLRESLDPRGREWLFELFASLGPKPGDFLLDVGARNGTSGPVGTGSTARPTSWYASTSRLKCVVEGVIEALPLEDESVDWIWARDMLVHVDLEPAFAECVRVLKPGGRMLAYDTIAVEIAERSPIAEPCALARFELVGRERDEAAASALTLEQKIELGSEWRERMVEDGEWDPTDALLRLARMRRLGIDNPIDRADLSWGIYQLLGKTCPTVYVWSKTSSD